MLVDVVSDWVVIGDGAVVGGDGLVLVRLLLLYGGVVVVFEFVDSADSRW